MFLIVIIIIVITIVAVITIAAVIIITAIIITETSIAILGLEVYFTALLYILYILIIKIVYLLNAGIIFLKKVLRGYIVNT